MILIFTILNLYAGYARMTTKQIEKAICTLSLLENTSIIYGSTLRIKGIGSSHLYFLIISLHSH